MTETPKKHLVQVSPLSLKFDLSKRLLLFLAQMLYLIIEERIFSSCPLTVFYVSNWLVLNDLSCKKCLQIISKYFSANQLDTKATEAKSIAARRARNITPSRLPRAIIIRTKKTSEEVTTTSAATTTMSSISSATICRRTEILNMLSRKKFLKVFPCFTEFTNYKPKVNLYKPNYLWENADFFYQ